MSRTDTAVRVISASPDRVIKLAARGRDRPTIISEGPPRDHERENTREYPADRRRPEPLVLRGFLYCACPRCSAVHTAEHDS
jgi:hypothetical protein